MRVTVHYPRIRVEEWELPALRPSDSDATALEMVAGTDGRPAERLSEALIYGGQPFVFARGDDDLEVAGLRLAKTKAAGERALEQARTTALAYLGAGVSEREVASTLGVDRSLVRAWQGKARGGAA